MTACVLGLLLVTVERVPATTFTDDPILPGGDPIKGWTMTRFQRALQIWSLLVCAAKDRRTYTYEDLASALGMGGAPVVVAQCLSPIMHYCRRRRLPPLTVLVVQKGAGRPGPGLTTVEEGNLDRDRERVFTYRWFQLEPPETSDFERACGSDEEGEDDA